MLAKLLPSHRHPTLVGAFLLGAGVVLAAFYFARRRAASPTPGAETLEALRFYVLPLQWLMRWAPRFWPWGAASQATGDL